MGVKPQCIIFPKPEKVLRCPSPGHKSQDRAECANLNLGVFTSAFFFFFSLPQLFCSMAATFTLNFFRSGIQFGSWGSFQLPGLLNFGEFKVRFSIPPPISCQFSVSFRFDWVFFFCDTCLHFSEGQLIFSCNS